MLHSVGQSGEHGGFALKLQRGGSGSWNYHRLKLFSSDKKIRPRSIPMRPDFHMSLSA